MRRRPAAPSVVVNLSTPTGHDAGAAARIAAHSNPETAEAIRNLHGLVEDQVLTESEFSGAKGHLLGREGGAAPAGWYDVGSGRLRWWDGQQWTQHFHGVQALPPVKSSHLGWALSPAYTLGLVSFIPALHAAMKLKRRGLRLWAGGLIAGNIVAWTLLSLSPSNPDGSSTPVNGLATVITMALAVLGTIQAFVVRDEIFAKSPAPVVHSANRSSAALDPAIARSLAARERRAEAAAISAKDPGLARDLRIGRPELARQFDDGGLIDVNHVPESVLVSHLGLSHDQARAVVEARDTIGGFESVAELCSLANLPPNTVDVVRDRVVTL